MSDVSRLFGEYLGTAAQSKQLEVAEAAQAKQAQFSGGYREAARDSTGIGPSVPLTAETILNPDGGDPDALAQEVGGYGQYVEDTTANRTTNWRTLGDSTVDIINGTLQGALGIGALGAGVVDRDAGTEVSSWADGVNDFASGLQSEALNARRRAHGERNSVTREENARLRAEEEADGASSTVAGLRQAGRDFLDGLTNSDAVTFQSGTAQGIGSLLLGGVIGKGIKAAGGALAARTAVGAAGPSRAAFAINAATKNGGMPLAIGALEGGGAYTQTVNEVMGMGHEDLLKGSPDYAELINQGWDPTDAKAEVANHAGLTAAAIQAPVGVATGALVSKFEATPFKVAGVKSAVGNILKETLEEGVQSGSGQLSTNIAIQQNADQDRSLTQDVGGQAAEGALYGMGTAGAVQAPGIPGSVVKAGLKGTAKVAGAAYDVVKTRADKFNEQLDAESPLSLNNTQARAEEAATAIQEPGVLDGLRGRLQTASQSEEQFTDGEAAIDKLINAVSFDGAKEAEDYQGGPVIAEILSGSTDRFDALKKITAAVKDPKLSHEDHAKAALWLMRFTNDHSADMVDKLGKAFEPLDDSDPAVEHLNNLAQIVSDFGSSPEVIRAIEVGKKITSKLTAAKVGHDARWAKIAADAAVYAPESVQPEVVDKVLEMAGKGNVPLTDGERQTLEAQVALRQIQQADENTSSELRLTKSHAIAYDIQHSDNVKGDFESLASHQQGISSAVRQGDAALAAARLKDLMLFAQHMNNKVAATNANLALNEGRGGSKTNTTPYQALGQQTRKFFEQKNGMWVNPIAPDSVRFAQRVGEDARAAVTLANRLAELHPELGIQPIDLTELDESLRQPAEQVRRAYKARNAEKIAAAQSQPLAQERSEPSQELNDDNANTTSEKPPVSAETGAEDAATRDTRQRGEDVAKPEAGVAAETASPDKPVENTNQSDRAEVEAESEVVEDTGKSEGESTAEPVDGNGNELADKPAVFASIEEAFPNLIDTGKMENKFWQGFKIPAKPISRLLGLGEKLFTTVLEALSSNTKLREFVGADNRFFQRAVPDEILKDYQSYLGLTRPIAGVVIKQLGWFMAKNEGRVLKALEANSDDQVTAWVNGRALNLIEKTGDGQYMYNMELLQGGILATLQWLLTANASARNQDREDIAKTFGVDINEVPADAPAYMNSGFGAVQAKQALAQTLRRFWGLQEAPDALIANSDGILEAFAGELLDAITKFPDKPDDTRPQGLGLLLADEPIQIGDVEFRRLLPVRDSEAGKLITRLKQTKADLIEKLVAIEPKETYFIGTPPSDVAQFQMKNDLVRTTKQQRELIERYQRVPFKANMAMVAFYESLTREQFVELFGAPKYDVNSTNINHAKSLDGQRVTADSAYDTFQELLGHIRQKADEDGVNPSEVEVFYEYGISSVGRLHMLGRNNPQASKIIREIMLPTRSTVDLATNEEHRKMFFAATFQHWDIKIDGKKVHQLPLDQIEAGVLKAAVEDFAQSIELMQAREGQLTPFSKEELQVLKSEFGNKLTPGALHALQEYARFNTNNTNNAAGNSQFGTALYLEADGVTDGPVNAMMHMGMADDGQFSETWVKVMAKGGLFIGDFGDTGKTLAEHFAQDSNDIYTEVKDALLTHLGELQKQIEAKGNRKTIEAYGSLLGLMGTMIDDMRFEGDKLIIDRGVTKNPVTVSIYGSGPEGIASKIANEIVDSIYRDLSDPATKGKVNQVWNAIRLLTNNETKTWDGVPYLKNAPADRRGGNSAKEFTFTPEEFANLRSAVQHMFVAPMIGAMDAVIGEVSNTSPQMQKAIQIQSLFMQHLFQDIISKILDERVANGGDRRDLLTRRELKSAYDQLKHLSPFISTGTQNLLISGFDQVDLRDGRGLAKGGKQPQAGSDFAERFRSTARVRGPVDAGVKAQPAVTISTGDGQMIQFYGTDPNSPDGLAVFDGYNLSIADATRGSALINKAVFDGWKMNPLADVSDAFSQFLGDIDLSSLQQMPALRKDIGIALFGKTFGETASAEQISQGLQMIEEQLRENALFMQARHNVLARTTLSVDHMASAAAPHINQGQITIVATDPAGIAAELNTHFNAELARLRKDGAGNSKVGETKTELTSELSNFGEPNEKFGTRTGGITEMRRLSRKLRLPAEHKALLDDVLKQLADSDYEITIGTLEQINAERDAQNLPLLSSDGEAKGFTLATEKRVYLIGSTSETLVHELIHAASFDRIFAYYNDPASLSQVQKEAVGRIETMMNQWIELALTEEGVTNNPELLQALRDSLRAVQGHLAKGNKAAALNEFMAWNLSNQELIKVGKKTSILGTLVELTTKALAAIKELIWGRAKAPAVGNDLFSNLRFNTSVVMNSAPTLDQKINAAEAVLEHAGESRSAQMQWMHDAFEQKIGRTVTAIANPGLADMRMTEIGKQLDNAIDMTRLFQARGFPMSSLQASTFQQIALAMMVDANLNPNALLRAQQLYASVMKNIKFEDFLVDPETATQEEEYLAQEKLKTLRGLHGTFTDGKDRSSLLVSFLALSMVDDGFRSVLSKLPVPAMEKSTDRTVDTILENFGIEAMDRNARAFSGEGGRVLPSVQAAIDAMFDKMTADAVANTNFADTIAIKTGNAIDTFNDLVVNSVKNATAALYDKLTSIEEGDRNRLITSLAKYGRVLVSIINEDKAELVGEGITSAMNQEGIPIWSREFWTEIAGRTKSNKTIYDMIKAVRTRVQQTRQQFREHLPKLIEKKFSRALEDHEWVAMTKVMAKTDLASLARSFPVTRLLAMLTNPAHVQREIHRLENRLQAVDPTSWPKWQDKAEQLADHMVHGYPGQNLLRNAKAIANLANELNPLERRNFAVPAQATIDMIDQLVSLYALQRVDPAQVETVKKLVTDEVEGMTNVMSLLMKQRTTEMAKVASSSLAEMNHFKGYVPTEQEAGTSLIVAEDTKFAELRKRGYVRVGPYQGSNAERNATSKSYYFAPVSGRAMFMQGIMQNVRMTAYGVDPRTGISNGPVTAGMVRGPVDTRLLRNQGGEPLLPIFDSNNEVIGYERSIDPVIAAKLNHNEQMHEVLGIWQGRQAEEHMASEFNSQLIERLGAQWQTEKRTKRSEYINLFSEEAQQDAVIKDAVSLITADVRDEIEAQFGRGQFWVRRNMVNDALGYRSPSVSDLWTGVSRWSPEVQKVAQDVTMGLFGPEAFKMIVKAEQTYQMFVADAKVTIVVKSVVVPIANMLSNVYHLAGRGVPLKAILKGFPAKAAEVDFFTKNRLRRMELQAEKRSAQAANNLTALHRIEGELKSILDSNRHLSIWPLIDANEFASISDAGISNEEIELTEGRLGAYIEKLTDKLPDGLKTAAKYGMVTRDTALFKGLQRTVEYGDFLAKAVLYDDLTKRQGKSHEEALGQITEEFINYDRQPGRWRSGLENNGILWFWNFKLRAAKVALSILRNNPVHMLLAHLVPSPDFLGLDVGTVSTDNFVSVIANDKEGWSIGLDQGFRAHMLNPSFNIGGSMI